MVTETGPITQLLRRGFHDPATNKLLSIGLTIYMIFVGIHNLRYHEIIVPFLVIFGSSLIYSIFALFIGLFKKEDSFTNLTLYKKLFGNVSFYEFQSTMAMILALSNLSGFFFVADAYRGFLMAVLTLSVVLLHLTDWYLNYQSIPKPPETEPESTDSIFTKIFVNIFKKCPIFFNLIQMACFIGATVLLATSTLFSIYAGYFFYCVGFSLLCLLFLSILQISDKKSSKKCGFARHSWKKYLLLAVCVHSFLALLNFSLLVEKVSTTETIWSFVGESDKVWNKQGHPIMNYVTAYKSPVITTTDDPLNSTRPHFSHTLTTYKIANAPIYHPFAFTLTVIAFIISFIRIQRAAMPSKPINFENEIDVPDSAEKATTNPDQKFNNLPTVIDILTNPDEIKIQPL